MQLSIVKSLTLAMHVGLFGLELGYDLNYFPFPYNASPPIVSGGNVGLIWLELGYGMNYLLQMTTLSPSTSGRRHWAICWLQCLSRN